MAWILFSSCQILCGNKSDLDSERQVTTDEAEKEATARGMAFLETSAKTGANIQEAFETLIKRTPRYGLEYKVCNPVTNRPFSK